MNSMIYYPGFEVKNITWLKFALLYFGELRPIIPDMPYGKERYLSEDACRIMDDTDFIRPYRPQYNEGFAASILACEEFEKYLSRPERYNAYWGKSFTGNIVERWKNPKHQNCTLFHGKYSREFHDFCLKNSIASPCDEGIIISEELAFVYMSFLADMISKNNELEIITDVQKYSHILMKSNVALSRSVGENLKTAKNNIDFHIPCNLSEISLNEIIRLRNQRDFNDCRKAFMEEISRLIVAKENHRPDYSLEDLLSCQKELISMCEKLLNMVFTTTIAIYSMQYFLAHSPHNSAMIALATAYVDFNAAKQLYSNIPQFIDNLKSKRLARRYVSKLGTLNASVRNDMW